MTIAAAGPQLRQEAETLSRTQFMAFRDLVYRNSGICLHEGKEALVQARIQRRLRALSIESIDAYLEIVKRDATGDELIHLLDAISTNVTYFFRESEHFDYLRAWLAEARRRGQRRWRIWSAASSSGEEPYSIAMIACEALGEAAADLQILATDLSTRMLASARAGIYTADRARAIPAALRERWMEHRGSGGTQTYAVREELKRLLTFRRLNLAQPPFPMKGPFDVIFCRNVMIYFDDIVRRKLIAEMSRLLRPGGVLIVGHAESLAGATADLKCIKPSIYGRP